MEHEDCPVVGSEFEDSQREVAKWMFIVTSVYMPLCLVWWFMRRRHFVLSKRSGKLMMVSAVGIYLQIFTTCYVNWKGLGVLPCDAQVFMTFLILPLAAGPVIVRLIQFYVKARYNQLLVNKSMTYNDKLRKTDHQGVFQRNFVRRSLKRELMDLFRYTFGNRSRSDSVSTLDLETVSKAESTISFSAGQETYGEHQAERVRSMSPKVVSAISALHLVQTTLFGIVILLFFLFLGFVGIAYQFLEPHSPYGKGCYGCSLDPGDIVAMAVVLVFVTASVFVVLWKMRKHKLADPLRIAGELKLSLICGVFVILGTVLSAIDPLGLREAGTFDWMYIVSVFSLLFFSILCVPPILSTYRIDTSARGNQISLRDILETPYAKALFAKYLATEFSLENLYFYDSVEEFKRMYMQGQDNDAQLYAMAQTIIDTFVTDRSLLEINLSHSIKKSMIERFSKTAKDSKPPSYLFDEALHSVMMLMESDSFPRFRKTHFFMEIHAEVVPSTSSTFSSYA